MRKILHPIYVFLGHIICRILLFKTKIYDKTHPIETDTVLFVTHPDDDTLFFHTAIKEYKPYVALMVTGWSIKRLRDFIKVMNNYGVRFRAYDTFEDGKNAEKKIINQINEVLNISDFKRVLTHNSEGEYGHRNHMRVHKCVVSNVDDVEILVPVSENELQQYPLPSEIVEEKTFIFNNYYLTETFVLDEYSDWVKNEKLVRYET